MIPQSLPLRNQIPLPNSVVPTIDVEFFRRHPGTSQQAWPTHPGNVRQVWASHFRVVQTGLRRFWYEPIPTSVLDQGVGQ
jgi:hypothetical protein